MFNLYDELSAICETTQDQYLSTMTTLRIGGLAKYVCYPETDIALDALIRLLNNHEVPYKMIGKGSDILCSDQIFDGVIIRLDRHYNDVIFENNKVTVQAGASIIALAADAAKRGLTGLEFACGIPGTVGGTIFMNAGAYKACMADVIQEVFTYHDGKLEWLPASECGFGYRTSIFQSHPDWIILAAKMELQPGDVAEIYALMENRRMRRLQSQPLDKPSCGSVFRNPEGMNAWELIEGIGYRGYRKGGAEVSAKHCNFIVNADNASASEYLALVEEIQKKVKDKYGVELNTEMEKFNW